MKNLALFGGKPTISELKPYKSISKKEIDAVVKVMKSGCLSGFYGSWEDGFLGGPEIIKLERNWSKKFKVKYSVSVNSNTSGLYCAMGAIGLSPGEEVIVPATSMSATAMAPIIYGGIPVFCDIEKDTFCIDIDSVKQKITKKTKAIIAVNLFGHPARLNELKKIAKDNKIFLIEDNAQAPLACENNKLTGTIGDIGVFSLNYHKHIHSGEGGICTTNNSELANRMQMIRNHAEAVVGPAKVKDITNLVGFNFRMTELSAAIANVQLSKIDKHVDKRVKLAESLSKAFKNLKGITVPVLRKNCSHVYYIWAIKYDEKYFGVKRDIFVKALNMQGFPCFSSYVRPLYKLPLFEKKIALGSNGFPFSLNNHNYNSQKCHNAEDLYENSFICFEPCAYEFSETKVSKLIEAFLLVYNNIYKLK